VSTTRISRLTSWCRALYVNTTRSVLNIVPGSDSRRLPINERCPGSNSPCGIPSESSTTAARSGVDPRGIAFSTERFSGVKSWVCRVQPEITAARHNRVTGYLCFIAVVCYLRDAFQPGTPHGGSHSRGPVPTGPGWKKGRTSNGSPLLASRRGSPHNQSSRHGSTTRARARFPLQKGSDGRPPTVLQFQPHRSPGEGPDRRVPGSSVHSFIPVIPGGISLRRAGTRYGRGLPAGASRAEGRNARQSVSGEAL
jgi:hypothetical protein